MSLDFSAPPRAPRGESIVPMINVVFLLLVFFLMTSRLAPPEAFEVTPPAAEAPGADGEGAALLVSAEGELAWRDLRGDAALAGFAAAAAETGAAPRLRADGALSVSYSRTRLNAGQILGALSAAGVQVRDLATAEPDLEEVFVSMVRNS